MSFTVKDWKDDPDSTTPLSAAALENLETRLSGYTDTVAAGLQPLDSDLTAIAALTTTTFGRSLLAVADAAAGRTALGLGTAATSASTAFDASGAAAAAQAASQPLDSDLTAIAALTTTSYGRAFLALADSSAALAALGSGTPAAGKYLDGAGAWTTLPAAGSGEPVLQTSGTTGNLGTAQTVDFSSTAREKWLAGTLNGNLAVTVSNPVAGSRLRVIALQDGTGSRTLTIAGTAVTIPTTASTGLAMVLAVWLDATNFRVESAGVYTESDPNAVLKSVGTTKGDLVAWTASGVVARQAVGTDGYALVADSSQTNGVKYSHRPQVATASKTGALTAAAGTVRLPIMEAGTIEDVRIMVGTSPTGSSLIVDVNKNGTTIFTTQGNRPTVAISGNASSAAVPDVTSLAAGDYLTVDIDQIGSTIAGSDLCVAVRYRLAA